MPDLACSVCGEPWDSDHVDHDMPLWKHLLFRAGKGCESCEGERPADADPERIVRAVARDGDERDKQHRIEAACEEKSYVDEWVKPPARVLATCDGCDEKIEIDQDEIYPYVRDGKQIGRVTIWDSRGSSFDLGVRREVPLDKLDPDEWGDMVDIQEWAGKKLCVDCRIRCGHCSAELFDGEAQRKFCWDTYDPGNSVYEDDETYCIECLESRPHCAKCEQSFSHDTELKDGLCEDCAPSDLLKCTECGSEVEEDEATRDVDEVRCVDCQIVKENEEGP